MSYGFPPLGYPGNGYYYVICDVCGKKVRFKDTVQIKDKYNYQNGLLVCRADADKTNPQAALRARKERRNPIITRGEPANQFVTTDQDYPYTYHYTDADDANAHMAVLWSEEPYFEMESEYEPSRPMYLQELEVTATTFAFLWIGPQCSVSLTISGYQIERATGSGDYVIIKENTSSGAGYYVDTGLTSGTTYTYRVSAINAAGVGEPSDGLTMVTL